MVFFDVYDVICMNRYIYVPSTSLHTTKHDRFGVTFVVKVNNLGPYVFQWRLLQNKVKNAYENNFDSSKLEFWLQMLRFQNKPQTI